MLPPLPPPLQSEVSAGLTNLENTSIPAFVNLYRHLTTHLLDHDGSTSSLNHSYETSGVARTLNASHVATARDAILVRALRESTLSISANGEGLPGELRELCHVVSSFLVAVKAGQVEVDAEVEDLMAEDLRDFTENLDVIADALSTHIVDLEGTITKTLQEPTTKSHLNLPSRIPTSQHTTGRAYTPHPNPPASSSSATTTLHARTQTQTTTLTDLLTTLSQTLHTHLTIQSTHLLTTLRHAEQHTHSTHSRTQTTHATFLATVAQGLALKSRILALQREKQVYAEEGVAEALRSRLEALVAEERWLVGRERELRGVLGEFGDVEVGVGVERGTFGVLGRELAGVEREVGRVRGEVEMLEWKMDGRWGEI